MFLKLKSKFFPKSTYEKNALRKSSDTLIGQTQTATFQNKLILEAWSNRLLVFSEIQKSSKPIYHVIFLEALFCCTLDI